MSTHERELRLSPLPVTDDRGALNRHQLWLPIWFYIRYPGHLEVAPDIRSAIENLFPDIEIQRSQLFLNRMPTLEECLALQQLSEERGCLLTVEQRSEDTFLTLVRRARAFRTGHAH
ncbi:hypothetical protein HQ487_05255 [Candidatus Uhrbacteria bacterium]|nr:hypothetical protein [Candidatus Uhrbacteria bacterium]